MDSEFNEELENEVVETDDLELDAGETDDAGTSETDGEEGQPEGEDEEKEPVDPWMETEDTGPVSVRAHVKLKKKFKAELGEKDTELEALKAKVAALETGTSTQQTQKLKVPDKYDFEDDADYEKAMAEYVVKLTSQQNNERVASERARKEAENTAKAVDNHFERADEFIKASNIKPDVYESADTAFRQTFEKILPKRGDQLADKFIEVLGDGSEKTLFYIGRNKAAQEKMTALVVDDPHGFKVAAYLGGLNEKFKNHKVTKQKTKARPPAAQATGGESIKGDAQIKALKKKYDSLHKKENIGEALKIKRQAKKTGVDVSKW